MKVSLLLSVCLWTANTLGLDKRLVQSDLKKELDWHDNARGSKKFIVEVEQGIDLAPITKHLHAKRTNNTVYPKAFDCSDIFSGFSLESDTENVDTLRQLEGVVNVWPMRAVKRSWTRKSAHFAPESRLNYSMHQWTGVDKLHAAGVRGKGATVAIVDTGIDYTHKALGGCFGPGCKIAGGYDLVGAEWDMHDERRYPKIPDDDPMDHDGHGTHVAGIIAAENEWLTGVAPDAELLIYKFPWDTDEESIIQAFCDAYSTGADIITASIGQPNGFSDNPWALVASRLVEKGIVVTIAAGNEGDSGPFYSSSGSNGHGVLSVAAANVTGLPHVNHANHSWDPVPCDFTTWGPTAEILLKPDIAAPGENVISTVLNQSYDAISGTSMSAPYIAGIAALYIGEHGGREVFGPGFAKMVSDRIKASGRSLPWLADYLLRNHTAPPFQVGTGLVDAWSVLMYDTQLTYEPFALLDTELFEPLWKVNITNNGNDTLNYWFGLEPQSGVMIHDKYYGISSLYQLEPQSIVPPVHLPDSIDVLPGETREVEFEFGLPDVDDDYLPLYGGKVWIHADNGEKLSISYGGAAYDTEKEFDTMFSSEPHLSPGTRSYSYMFDFESRDSEYITISANLAYPCFHLRWDIYESYWSEGNWKYPPQLDGHGYVGTATTVRDSDEYWFYDPDVVDKYDTVAFPLMRVPRGFQTFWWFGVFANGTRIAPGNYTIRFAALRPYGNPNISDHWDIMEPKVPTIQILPFNGTHGGNKTHQFTWSEPH